MTKLSDETNLATRISKMKDLLPDAHIRISIPAIEFLEEMAAIASVHGCPRVVKHYRVGDGTMNVLNIDPTHQFTHKELYGQLIHKPEYSDNIHVEARAQQWAGSSEPSYEAYVDALKEIFTDLVKAYNKKHRTRYRLTINRQQGMEHPLSPKAIKTFELFAISANKECLHSSDWSRFYKFAGVCHALHQAADEVDIGRLLVHTGFREEYAQELASVYQHLRNFQEP